MRGERWDEPFVPQDELKRAPTTGVIGRQTMTTSRCKKYGWYSNGCGICGSAGHRGGCGGISGGAGLGDGAAGAFLRGLARQERGSAARNGGAGALDARVAVSAFYCSLPDDHHLFGCGAEWAARPTLGLRRLRGVSPAARLEARLL